MLNNMSSELRKKLIFVVVVMVVLAAGALWGSKDGSASWGKKNQEWVAVYLNNNQVYFGHIVSTRGDTLVLKDVHFAEQVNIPAEKSTSKNFAVEQPARQTFRLTQRGDDSVLTSDHTLYVNRTNVLYWEKLDKSSEIVKMLEGGK